MVQASKEGDGHAQRDVVVSEKVGFGEDVLEDVGFSTPPRGRGRPKKMVILTSGLKKGCQREQE